MKIEFEFDVTDKMRLALADAARLVESGSIRASATLGPDWKNRHDQAIATMAMINLEVTDALKRQAVYAADVLARADFQIILAMIRHTELLRTLNASENRSTILVHGAEPPLPWWTHLPGGAKATDMSDDIATEVHAEYDETLMELIATWNTEEHGMRLDLQDHYLCLEVLR